MRKLAIILSASLLMGMCGCSRISNSDSTVTSNNQGSPYADYFECEAADMSEYDNISLYTEEIADFQSISWSDATTLLQNGVGVLYFGSPSCHACNTIIPVLNQAAVEVGATIYYVDVTSAPEIESDVFQSCMDELEDIPIYDNDGNKNIRVPLVVGTRKGTIVGRMSTIFKGTTYNDDGTLSQESYDLLKTTYTGIINAVN